MKRSLIVLGLGALFAAAPVLSGPATAQTRVTVEVGVVAPPVYGHVVIGEPRVVYRAPRYHGRYHKRYHRHRRPAAVVVVVPRQPYRYHSNGRYYYYR